MIRFLGLLAAPDVVSPSHTSSSSSYCTTTAPLPHFDPLSHQPHSPLTTRNSWITTHTHTYIYTMLFSRVILNTTRHPCRIPSSRKMIEHCNEELIRPAGFRRPLLSIRSNTTGPVRGSVRKSRSRAVGRPQHANALSAVQNTVCKSPPAIIPSLLAATSSLPPFLSFVRHASYPLLRCQMRSSRFVRTSAHLHPLAFTWVLSWCSHHHNHSNHA
jgi:hypothetical protein